MSPAIQSPYNFNQDRAQSPFLRAFRPPLTGILGDVEEFSVVFGMPQVSTAPIGVTLTEQTTSVACEIVIAAIRQAEASKTYNLSVGIPFTRLVDSTYELARYDTRVGNLKRKEIGAAIQRLEQQKVLTICKANGNKKFYRLTDAHNV